MTGPVHTATGAVAELLRHFVGIDGGTGAVGFHHCDPRGGAADGADGASGGANGVTGPAAVCLFKAGDL